MQASRPTIQIAAKRLGILCRSLTAISLTLYAFTVPFQRAFGLGGLGSPAAVAGALALLCGIPAVVLAGRRQPMTAAVLAAFALMPFVVWSLAWSPLPTEAPEPGLRALGPATATTALQLAVLLWLMWEFTESRRDWRRLLVGYVLGAHVAALFVFRSWLADDGFTRNRFTGGDAILPNPQAFTLAIAIPMAWYLFTTSGSGFVRLASLVYMPAGAAAVFLTGSRTGFFALAVGLLIVPLTIRSLPPLSRSVAIALMVVALPLVPSLIPEDTIGRATVTSESSDLESAAALRGELRATGVEVFLEHPFTGSGAGAVRERVADTEPGYDTDLSSHNSLINIAAEFGAFALALYAFLVVSIIGAARVGPWNDRVLAALICFVTIVDLQFVNLEFHKTTWLVFGLMLVQRRIAASSVDVPLGPSAVIAAPDELLVPA